MILDDENILIDNACNSMYEDIYCENLGKIYMTKRGELGYVCDVKADGTPKILLRVSEQSISLRDLLELENAIKRFEVKEGWYIPTREQLFANPFSWADSKKYNLNKILEKMIFRMNTQCHKLTKEYWRKSQICPLFSVNGNYWLRREGNFYDLTMFISIYDFFGSCVSGQNSVQKLLFLKNLEDYEIQSYEESDNMIRETIYNLPLGRF